MTKSPTAPEDSVEKFLDQMEIRSDFYEDHDTKRVLRICKKYWEALEEIRQEECWESTNCMSGVRACDPCIAREALAYTGTEEK